MFSFDSCELSFTVIDAMSYKDFLIQDLGDMPVFGPTLEDLKELVAFDMNVFDVDLVCKELFGDSSEKQLKNIVRNFIQGCLNSRLCESELKDYYFEGYISSFRLCNRTFRSFRNSNLNDLKLIAEKVREESLVIQTKMDPKLFLDAFHEYEEMLKCFA